MANFPSSFSTSTPNPYEPHLTRAASPVTPNLDNPTRETPYGQADEYGYINPRKPEFPNIAPAVSLGPISLAPYSYTETKTYEVAREMLLSLDPNKDSERKILHFFPDFKPDPDLTYEEQINQIVNAAILKNEPLLQRLLSRGI